MARLLAAAALAAAARGQFLAPFDEEPPEDERPPAPLPPLRRHVLCYVSPDGAVPQRPPWRPAEEGELPPRAFTSGAALREYLAAHHATDCAYAHVDPAPQHGWLREVLLALRGRVARVVVVDKVDAAEATCAELVGAKKEGIVERERCRLPSLRGSYGECKCTRRARSKSKPLLCVPAEHSFPMLDPSPLLRADVSPGRGLCLLRMSYYPSHLDPAEARPATYTPQREYPRDASRASACALAYVNSKRVLEGTAETFLTWVPHFLAPQGFPLYLYREEHRIPESEVVRALRLSRDGSWWRAMVGGVQSPPVHLGAVQEEAVEEQVNRTALRAVRPRCGCPPTCGPHTRRSPEGYMVNTLRYVLGTRVFTLELLQDPRLRDYDFVIKVDWDIRFYRTVEHPILPEVVAGKYLGFHTGYANNGRGCSRDAQAAVDAYARSRGLRALSAGDWAYENDDVAWHSALFMIWTGFVLSPEYKDLLHSLRSGPYALSWWRHRWTDQTVWPKAVGLFHSDIPARLLDLRHLRWHPHRQRPQGCFYHRKSRRSPSELARITAGRADKGSAYTFCARGPGNASARMKLDACER